MVDNIERTLKLEPDDLEELDPEPETDPEPEADPETDPELETTSEEIPQWAMTLKDQITEVQAQLLKLEDRQKHAKHKANPKKTDPEPEPEPLPPLARSPRKRKIF